MKDESLYRPVRKHIYRLSLRWTGREDMGGGGPVVNQKPVWKTTLMSLPHAVNRLLPFSWSLFSASVSWFLLFFSPLFVHMHHFRCAFMSHRGTLVSRLQFCGSWMYNTVSVCLCLCLSVSVWLCWSLCLFSAHSVIVHQHNNGKTKKCQRTMNKALEICASDLIKSLRFSDLTWLLTFFSFCTSGQVERSWE